MNNENTNNKKTKNKTIIILIIVLIIILGFWILSSDSPVESGPFKKGDILVDNEGFQISITDVYDGKTVLDVDAYWVEFELTNNSDKEVEFSTDSFIVNGYSIDASLYSDEVSSAGKTKDEICIYKNDLEKIGVNSLDEINEVKIKFIVEDVDEYETIFEQEVIIN